MRTKEAIQHFGSVPLLVKALKLKARQTIYAWGEYPPFPRQCQIQLLTKNKLKADKEGEIKADITATIKAQK